jgi:hypothetical protein
LQLSGSAFHPESELDTDSDPEVESSPVDPDSVEDDSLPVVVEVDVEVEIDADPDPELEGDDVSSDVLSSGNASPPLSGVKQPTVAAQPTPITMPRENRFTP